MKTFSNQPDLSGVAFSVAEYLFLLIISSAFLVWFQSFSKFPLTRPLEAHIVTLP
jgi:hypothetical protein